MSWDYNEWWNISWVFCLRDDLTKLVQSVCSTGCKVTLLRKEKELVQTYRTPLLNGNWGNLLIFFRYVPCVNAVQYRTPVNIHSSYGVTFSGYFPPLMHSLECFRGFLVFQNTRVRLSIEACYDLFNVTTTVDKRRTYLDRLNNHDRVQSRSQRMLRNAQTWRTRKPESKAYDLWISNSNTREHKTRSSPGSALNKPDRDVKMFNECVRVELEQGLRIWHLGSTTTVFSWNLLKRWSGSAGSVAASELQDLQFSSVLRASVFKLDTNRFICKNRNLVFMKILKGKLGGGVHIPLVLWSVCTFFRIKH